MNIRLLAYLRSLGLAQDATEQQAWEFYAARRGVERSIANCLNYNDNDNGARTNCDLALRALGYNADLTQIADPEPAQRGATFQSLLPADTQGAGGDGASLVTAEAARTQLLAELAARNAEIRQYATVAGTPEDVVRTLLDDPSIDAEAARQRIWEDHQARNRTELPGAPAGHSRNSVTGADRNSLTAALLMRQGINDPMQAWPTYNDNFGSVARTNRSSDAELERAVDFGHELSGLSMVELVARCLRADGTNVEPMPNAIGAAMNRAGVSTSTLTGVFTTTYAAMMLAGFEDAPDTTQGWTVEREVPDFKQNERTRMGKMSALTKLGKGGTAEDMTMSDAQEVYKVSRYAGKFTIDEQDLINDTFGALNDYTPDEMGASARMLRPDLVYAIMLANANMRDGAALFVAGHGNLTASSALAVGTLETVRMKMRIQQENGRNLNLAMKYLIVPPTLEPTAETLVVSNLVVTGSDIVRGEINSNARAGLTVVSDARLENGVVDPNSGTTYAGSASTWFGAATAGRHTIEVGYLRGMNRAPRVRSYMLDKGQFGIGFDVSHDIGAKALDWRGLAKATA